MQPRESLIPPGYWRGNFVAHLIDSLMCIGCGGHPTRMMMLNMIAGRDALPSILIAYALCSTCSEERCGETALHAMREAVAPEST